jgi:ABC-type branched-subunit amino acid transport system ATPase component
VAAMAQPRWRVIRLSSGRVLIGPRRHRPAAGEVARAGVGYVPQVDDVFAPLTVRENLEVGGYLLAGREEPADRARSERVPRGSARC